MRVVMAMGSLLEELARRESAVRLRMGEIREQIAGLEVRLEAEEARLSRLVITRETVEEVLGEAAPPVQESDGDAEGAGVEAVAVRSALGVVTVPPWRPGLGVAV